MATDRQTNRQIDRQTDEQMDSTDALSRSHCRERRLNKANLVTFLLACADPPYVLLPVGKSDARFVTSAPDFPVKEDILALFREDEGHFADFVLKNLRVWG